MTYALEAAGALADVMAAGASVTFTRVTQNVAPTTGVLLTPTTTTIPGGAVRVKGDPETYKKLSLIDSQSPTLFFVPSTYGSTPLPGDTVLWNSTTYTAQDVAPIAPDGVTIAARVILVL